MWEMTEVTHLSHWRSQVSAAETLCNKWSRNLSAMQQKAFIYCLRM